MPLFVLFFVEGKFHFPVSVSRNAGNRSLFLNHFPEFERIVAAVRHYYTGFKSVNKFWSNFKIAYLSRT